MDKHAAMRSVINLPLWMALMAPSLLGIAATLLFGRKKRVFDR